VQPVADRSPAVLFVAEQLRRRVPGGIGVHARGILAGLVELASEGEAVDLTLLASRPRRRPEGAGDAVAQLGWPVRLSSLPGPVLTRAWEHGLVHAPPGFEVVHSVSMAAPFPRHGGTGRPVVTVHDLAWRRFPESTTPRGARWHEDALARARRAAAHIVVPSRLVAEDVVASGVEEHRVTVVLSGADHLPAPDAAGADALLRRVGVGGEFLLSVGTLEPRKNLERLVRAFGAVRRELPEPWSLVIVGPTGWGGAGGNDLATSMQAESHPGVVFAGAPSDPVLAALYSRARAFAFVPLTEGSGLPPLEAMRMGTPAIVAHGVPSVWDVGQVGHAPALLVDPLDVEEITAGLLRVLTDDALRAELAARGPAHARQRTWRAAAAAHVALWRSLR
jgi:glycosyltransferase involved in cell wall biosynthesis